jgi:hypothetical protein
MGAAHGQLLRDGERLASQFLETFRSSSRRTPQGCRRTLAKKKNQNQVPIDDPDDLEWNEEHQVCHFKVTTLSAAQQFAVKLCKRIKQLGGELPMNWLNCELIYLERFAQKLQRRIDRKVIGF